MVRANICPSIYQRTDAQTFLELGGGEGKPTRRDSCSPSHTTTTTTTNERSLLLLADPLFFETMWQMD